MDEPLIGLRTGTVNLVDADVVEGVRVKLRIMVRPGHGLHSRKDKIRLCIVFGSAVESHGPGIAKNRTEGLHGRTGNVFTMDDEKDAFCIESAGIEGGKIGFPSACSGYQKSAVLPFRAQNLQRLERFLLHRVGTGPEPERKFNCQFLFGLAPGANLRDPLSAIDPRILQQPIFIDYGRRCKLPVEFAADIRNDGSFRKGCDPQIPLVVGTQGILRKIAAADDQRVTFSMLENIPFGVEVVFGLDFQLNIRKTEQPAKCAGLRKILIG